MPLSDRIREILYHHALVICSAEETGAFTDAEMKEFYDKNTAAILEEMEKGILSEEEIGEILRQKIFKGSTWLYSTGRNVSQDEVSHALYTAQKEKIK